MNSQLKYFFNFIVVWCNVTKMWWKNIEDVYFCLSLGWLFKSDFVMKCLFGSGCFTIFV